MKWFMLVFICLITIVPIVPLLVLDALGMAEGLHEGNSDIATLPWMLFFTVPLGLVLLVAWLILHVFLGDQTPRQ